MNPYSSQEPPVSSSVLHIPIKDNNDVIIPEPFILDQFIDDYNEFKGIFTMDYKD